MACFTAPLASAIAATAAKSAIRSESTSNPFVRRIGWLQKMLFGGSLLLAIEHAWHGEITWRYPFLTAVRDGDAAGMLHEIATVGVAMTALVVAVWAIAVMVAVAAEKRESAAQEA